MQTLKKTLPKTRNGHKGAVRIAYVIVCMTDCAQQL